MGFQTNQSSQLNSDINITPLVDVMLVLLIIFMVTAPMLNAGVDINLPKTDAAILESPDSALTLSIDKHRKIHIGTVSVTWTSLEKKLKANPRIKQTNELYIEADQTLNYGVVVRAMAIARRAGVTKLFMVTDPHQTKTPLETLDAL